MYESLEFKRNLDSKHHSAGSWGRLRCSGTEGLGAGLGRQRGEAAWREQEVTVGQRNSMHRSQGKAACGGCRGRDAQNLAQKPGWESTQGFGRQQGAVNFFYMSVRNSTLGRLNCKLARRFLQEGRITPGKR